MLKEFKAFAPKGNLIEIAVGLILALAFAAVVVSFTEDIIAAIVAAIVGQPDFSELTIQLGDAEIRYGSSITVLVNFLIVAFVLFLIVKGANTMISKKAEDAGPTEVELLTEIRDALRSRGV